MEKSFLIEFISNPFVITVLFIVVSTVVAAFIRRVTRDKCLKDFAGDMVTLHEVDGDLIRGELIVANTGLEFIYPAKQTNEHGAMMEQYEWIPGVRFVTAGNKQSILYRVAL
jgi:hypothetical protein